MSQLTPVQQAAVQAADKELTRTPLVNGMERICRISPVRLGFDMCQRSRYCFLHLRQSHADPIDLIDVGSGPRADITMPGVRDYVGQARLQKQIVINICALLITIC